MVSQWLMALAVSVFLFCTCEASAVNQKKYIDSREIHQYLPSLKRAMSYRRLHPHSPSHSDKLPSFIRQNTEPEGYNFDDCQRSSDCISPRRCFDLTKLQLCQTTFCFCFQEKIQLCRTCSDCDNNPNETCQRDPYIETISGVCLSSYVNYQGFTVELGCDSFPDITPIPQELVGTTEGDSQYDPSNDIFANSDPLPTLSASPAAPSPAAASPAPPAAESPAAPAPAESPAANSVEPASPVPSTSSAATSTETDPPAAADPSPSTPSSAATEVSTGGDDDVCIDARVVDTLPKTQHVYEQHRIASVLCDIQGSCATPGHMVVFEGRAMSMATYCRAQAQACAKKVMHVNSPRYARALKLASNTKGLYFTAFAARHETMIEEIALRTVIHLGA